MKKDDWKALSRLGDITGFGLSLVAPVFLLCWLASWLTERFGLGDWVMAAAIVCGVISAGCTFVNFTRGEIRRAEREGEEYLRQQRERGNKGGGQDEA